MELTPALEKSRLSFFDRDGVRKLRFTVAPGEGGLQATVGAARIMDLTSVQAAEWVFWWFGPIE
jgi:hypothetical protein